MQENLELGPAELNLFWNVSLWDHVGFEFESR